VSTSPTVIGTVCMIRATDYVYDNSSASQHTSFEFKNPFR